MARSIYWKITIPLTMLVLLSIGILGFYTVDYSRDTQVEHLRSHLVKEAKLVADASSPALQDPVSYDGLDTLAKAIGGEIDARITITSRDGTVLGDSEEDPLAMENHSTRPEVVDALASGVGESTRYSM